ncbi:hypothetical protein A2160_05950 [Candidatus Beckwithbacteria bacterium RBG_13_42_9]|uniref:DNA polymerase III subunit delta n=1 Tax=Candidatus Beckwithbacteria bacterium RBG_13_42_9 TaxID=1797457 RepID=A0A1F5E5C5_9BACT|nr:MAG: hypothetical protein A2160_05950 [Candidatus Beckwithbacteria bacterium RBG_13_42_9]
MHAFILTTINKELIAAKLIKLADLEISGNNFFNQPDAVVIEPNPSITIAQIRKLQTALSRKPLKLPKQFGIILSAQLMTLAAQNAFLKLLEEPTKDTILCLSLENPWELLPTILSRCQIIKIQEARSKKQEASAQSLDIELKKLLVKLLRAGIGERLILIEPYGKNRAEALVFCQSLIEFLENQLHIDKPFLPLPKLQKILKKSLDLHLRLKQNLNVRLSLDQWALGI